ncbi:PP2C family protein-serine/threonine phosphatase [Marinomonas algarum]|uniref:SpoIIE family protein phosphatase n=1 Tax=Marinomonas algarum TaxID=2883105 RepID=A0A9X1LDS5_9GAMM|nr:SpoIIE family protein phosphatase [Marinomonas algarum]MCB5160318.1 SpoIIE family protein phosphatase [Marinomonas algarum]
MKLLCVDIDAVYRDIISLYAEKEGMAVKIESEFDAARSSFREFMPDIVIVGVVSELEQSFALLHALKAASGDRFTPIICLSDHATNAVMDRCFQSGADDFISKPFNEGLFHIRLKTHLRHIHLMKEMYRKNKALTYYQTMIEREHEMAHHVLDHIQGRSEKNSQYVAITRLSAASFNGDLALVKTRSDGARLVFVGDFTGHGLPASIGALPIMQAFFDAVDDLLKIEVLAEKMNRILLNILPDYMFCAGYLIYMGRDGDILYWGGGMPNALIRRTNGEMDYLRSTHMPLGILPASEFEGKLEANQLSTGDTLIIVSDGVLELKNSEGLMFGDEKALQLIQTAYAEKDLIKAQYHTEKVLADYRGESAQLDDITLVALRC